MGDWTQRLREARADALTGVNETAEDDDQGHMSAAEVGKRLGAGADAALEEGTERWVSSVSISAQHAEGATLAITIDLGRAGLPPGIEAQLKIAGGEVIPGTRFHVTCAGGSCSATLEAGPEAARILQAHAQGKLVAVFEKWPAEKDPPPRKREAPHR